jgi:hypothetical protein
MADYKPLNPDEQFGHASIDRPFPSGGIALASGEAMYADFSQYMNYPSGHSQNPAQLIDSPSGVIAMSELNTIPNPSGTLADFLPTPSKNSQYKPSAYSNAHKHDQRGIKNFGVFNSYVHYTPHPKPNIDINGNIDYGVFIPKFVPNASVALFNTYVSREPEPADSGVAGSGNN